jgi:hypothetical protein
MLTVELPNALRVALPTALDFPTEEIDRAAVGGEYNIGSAGIPDLAAVAYRREVGKCPGNGHREIRLIGLTGRSHFCVIDRNCSCAAETCRTARYNRNWHCDAVAQRSG